MDYKGKTLIGKNITYSADLELLDATGRPLLIEGADKLYGDRMDYDLEVGAGLVRQGTTKFMDGYYNGETIAKVGDDVLKVWNSTYTTCDLKVPHYHLTSDRMKVYLDDKVVTGPLVLYLGDTPLIALPFFAQNIRRGRRSGILRPEFEFGITSQKDRFIRNVGYYWATNDYTDFTFIADFNENRSFRFYIDNRYKLRYVFDGGLNFSWYKRSPGQLDRMDADRRPQPDARREVVVQRQNPLRQQRRSAEGGQQHRRRPGRRRPEDRVHGELPEVVELGGIQRLGATDADSQRREPDDGEDRRRASQPGPLDPVAFALLREEEREGRTSRRDAKIALGDPCLARSLRQPEDR